mgnify:CR=1 FL=1
MKLKRPQRKEDILSAWYGLMDYLHSEQIQAGFGIRIQQTAGGKVISSKHSEFPWSKVLFGYDGVGFTGDVFTVKAGEIDYGGILDVAATPVTVSADATYIYVELPWFSTSPVILGSTTRPQTDTQCFRKWLYQVGYSSGAITEITAYGHAGGGILISSGYAKAP